jgi:AcrR family transcriptional regulator
MRADARRNYNRLLAAAREAFAEHGTDASLDDIARKAEVANATLYRHFPTREALLDAVFRDRVEALCDHAVELLSYPSPEDALVTWLEALIVHVATYRGLASRLMSTAAAEERVLTSCRESIRAAGMALLTRAQRSGAIRPDLSTPRLLTLTHAIALATEHTPDQAGPLLSLVLDGLRTAPSHT